MTPCYNYLIQERSMTKLPFLPKALLKGQTFTGMQCLLILFCSSRQLIKIQKRIQKRANPNKRLVLLILSGRYQHFQQFFLSEAQIKLP
jgi:hypothetical protein